MKKIIITAILFALFFSASAKDIIIKDTTINKVVYSMYQGARGGKYIMITSKTGTKYRKYFKNKTLKN
jgi:hypothetical protein